MNTVSSKKPETYGDGLEKKALILCLHYKNVAIMIFFMMGLFTNSYARVSLVAFPLKNENDKVYSWISAIFPEMLSRGLIFSSETRVYDPAFIFQTDSSVWNMNSDSLLNEHRQKWLWDAATGGSFKIIHDSIYIFIKVAWSVDRQEPVLMEFQESGSLNEISKIFAAVSKKMLSLVKINLSDEENSFIGKKISSSKEAYETYIAGYFFEIKGNIPDALTAYSRSLEIDPSIVIAACRLGRLYALQKKYDIAKKLYDRTLNENRNDPIVVAYMADFLSTSYLPEVALQFIETNRAILSLTSKGLSASGSLYLHLGEYQRAIAMLTRAVAAGPENLDAEFLLGQAWLHMGEYERAIDIFNRLIKCQPDYLQYYSSIGSAYRKSGKLMQAAMTLQSALKRGPRNVIIMIDLSQIWIELKWYEQALQLLKQAETINPGIGDTYINMGLAYWYSGEEDSARKSFDKAMLFPDVKQSALINSGNIFFTKQEYKKAISLYNKALESGKKNPSLEYNLAISYLLIGKEAKAIQHFDALLMLAPERIDVLLKRAQIALDLEEFDDAEHFFRRVLEITPQDKQAVHLLVNVYMSTRKYDDAIRTVEDYLVNVPSSLEFTIQLAEIYQIKGWYDIALEKYQDIIRDFPDSPDGYLGLGKCMYEMILKNKTTNYDDAIFSLKYASEREPQNPLPDELIGNIYFNNKRYVELALDHWNKAIGKTVDESKRKILKDKIRSVK